MNLSKKLSFCTISFIVSLPLATSAASSSLDTQKQGEENKLLIKNGDFDNGLDAWIVSSPGTDNPTVVTDEDGNNYVKASDGENIHQYVSLKPETTYEFSYSVIGDANFPAIVSFGTLNSGEDYVSLQEEKHTNQEWKPHNFTFTTPKEENTYIIRFASSGNGTALFDKIKAELVDLEPPTKPQNLQITAVTDNSASLKWEASTDNVGVTEYEIYRDGEKVGKTAGDKLTYKDTGLNEETTYTYTVKAKDEAGNLSMASDSVTATTNRTDRVAPSAPTNLQVINVSFNSVTIGWEASTDNVKVTGYQVYRDDQKIGETTETKPYMDQDLTENTTYTYVIKAKDAAGNVSEASKPLSVTTTTKNAELVTLSAPANLEVVDLTSDSVTITWEDPAENEEVTGYQIYREREKVGEVAKDQSTYTDSGLKENTTYTYSMKTVSKTGETSQFSEDLSVTTEKKAADLTASSETEAVGAAQAAATNSALPKTGSKVHSFLGIGGGLLVGVSIWLSYRGNRKKHLDKK